MGLALDAFISLLLGGRRWCCQRPQHNSPNCGFIRYLRLKKEYETQVKKTVCRIFAVCFNNGAAEERCWASDPVKPPLVYRQPSNNGVDECDWKKWSHHYISKTASIWAKKNISSSTKRRQDFRSHAVASRMRFQWRIDSTVLLSIKIEHFQNLRSISCFNACH